MSMGHERSQIMEQRHYRFCSKENGEIHEKKKIEDLASKNDPTSKNVRKSLLEEMEELLQKEETMWRQRSRALWLKVFSQKDFLGEQRKIESRILRIAMATW